MRYIFIINPAAGKGKIQKDIYNKIKACFPKREENSAVYFTEFKGEAVNIAKNEAKKGGEIKIFACGGEGTVFEVLNGIIGFENASIGVIPCGSANDFLKFFKSSAPFSDLAAQIKGKSVKIDAIKANDFYCLNGCSIGMDAVVARDMQIYKRLPLVTGPLAYNLAIVKTFLGKIGISAKISLDGKKSFFSNCLFAVAANAPFYGGGYMAAPKADPFDGQLDFTLVEKISKLKIPNFLNKYKKGKHAEFDYCVLKTCRTMEFSSEKPVPVNLDGEISEISKMKFEIAPKAVNFILPEGVEVENVNKKLNVFDFT